MITPYSLFSRAIDFLVRHKRLFVFLVAVFLIVIGISALCRGGIGPPPRRTDLTVFLRAAEAVRSGENIYAVVNGRGWYYVYLPLLAILLVPFARLPLLLNTTLWYLLSAAAFCWSVLLSARLVDDRSAGVRAAVMAQILCIPPILETMTRGQMGTMSVFLAVAILYLYVRGYAVWTGILLAFSVVLKASPLAFLGIFFLAKREWKVCIAAALGGIFFAVIFPALTIGAELNWSYVQEWHGILGHAVSATGQESHIWSQLATPIARDNQSLYAVITRWLYPTETALAATSNDVIRWGVRLFGIVALALLAFLSRRKKTVTSRKRLLLEYSLFPALMILVSPVSEMHHYTIFFLPFFAVLLYLEELPRRSGPYQWLMWALLIAAVTQILGYVRPCDMWGMPAIGALILCCVSFAFLLGKEGRC